MISGTLFLYAGLLSFCIPASIYGQGRPSGSPPAPLSNSVLKARPDFAVVSVKPNKSDSGRWYLKPTADGYAAVDVSLRMLISEAYGIYDPKRILEGPEWINSEKYDVEAKVDGSDVAALSDLDKDQRRSMLQPLLKDRFQLAAHMEERLFPIYELVLAKGGPKLQVTPSDEVNESSKVKKAHVTRSKSGQLTVESFTMADLARSLSLIVSRPITDKTGLAGHYSFTLDWTPDDSDNSRSSQDVSQAPAKGGSFPSIFTALPEQLGLRLQSVKDPIEVLVIDHVERPSTN